MKSRNVFLLRIIHRCGNVLQDLQYSTCGRCGEAPGNRDASQGGIFDKGIIVRSYTAGSVSAQINIIQ